VKSNLELAEDLAYQIEHNVVGAYARGLARELVAQLRGEDDPPQVQVVSFATEHDCVFTEAAKEAIDHLAQETDRGLREAITVYLHDDGWSMSDLHGRVRWEPCTELTDHEYFLIDGVPLLRFGPIQTQTRDGRLVLARTMQRVERADQTRVGPEDI